MGKFSERDIIYVNKSKETGIKELRNLKRKAYMSFTYTVLLFGIAVYTYVQYVLYSSATQCKRNAPLLYVWLIVEAIIFYVSLTMFLCFGGYYAWRYKDSSFAFGKGETKTVANLAAERRKRFEYL